MVLTGDDDGEWFGRKEPVDAEAEANEILAGRHVEDTSIDADTGDLHVLFSGAVRLDLIHNSRGYEAWEGGFQLKEYQVQLIAGGGGDFSYAAGVVGRERSFSVGNPLPR